MGFIDVRFIRTQNVEIAGDGFECDLLFRYELRLLLYLWYRNELQSTKLIGWINIYTIDMNYVWHD